MDTPSLEGALNFRDVGGMPAGDGRQVRHGVLFRSDTLQFLTAEDIHTLVEQLGLRSDIDLRLGYEIKVEGRGLLEDEASIGHYHLPLQVDGAVREGTATPILQQNDPVVNHYLGYLDSSAASLVSMIQLLATPEGSPAIIHCAAGKDRTGIAVAMVLAALGCAEEDIATEYAAGSHLIEAVLDRLRGMESYGAALDKLPKEANLTPPEYVQRFFERVGELYGGPIEFLKMNGVTDEQLQSLRDLLTEPAK